VHGSMLQCVTVCYSVLHCVAAAKTKNGKTGLGCDQEMCVCVAVCVAVCCPALQCVAVCSPVCCSVLHFVEVCISCPDEKRRDWCRV